MARAAGRGAYTYLYGVICNEAELFEVIRSTGKFSRLVEQYSRLSGSAKSGSKSAESGFESKSAESGFESVARPFDQFLARQFDRFLAQYTRERCERQEPGPHRLKIVEIDRANFGFPAGSNPLSADSGAPDARRCFAVGVALSSEILDDTDSNLLPADSGGAGSNPRYWHPRPADLVELQDVFERRRRRSPLLAAKEGMLFTFDFGDVFYRS